MFDFINRKVFAQGQWEYLSQISNVANEPSNITKIEHALGMVINLALGIALSVSFIGTILSGIKFMQSRSGDPREMETAKKALTYSLVAFFLSISAFTIMGIIVRNVGLTAPGRNPYKLFRVVPIPSAGSSGHSGGSGIYAE